MVWHMVHSFLTGQYSGEEAPQKQEEPKIKIQHQIDKVKNELTRLVQRSATMTDDAYRTFEEVIKATQSKLSNLEQKRDKLEPVHRPYASPAKLRKEYAKRIENLSFAERVRCMRDLDVQCTWDGKTLTCILQGRWTYRWREKADKN
jgi:DNA repair ATPase RecN